LVDQEKIERAVASIIEALGEDAKREGLLNTPRRVAQMYAELFAGIGQDPAEVLATGFEEDHHEMVVLRRIPFFSVCEHHLLPFFGSAAVGYVPNGRVVGASKLVRALDIIARRPQLQERLTRQVVDAIFDAVKPQGVAVRLTAEHMCMSIRGVRKPGSQVVTSAARGTLKTHEPTIREFNSLLGDG
jgi:GTP cyclohydrolase I